MLDPPSRRQYNPAGWHTACISIHAERARADARPAAVGVRPEKTSMLYSPPMSATNALDPLTRRLRAWGLHALTAAVLEQAEPVAFLGAQLLHVVSPAASLVGSDKTLTALAALLEDPQARLIWARQLAQAEDDPA
jgi:hypothetical protein